MTWLFLILLRIKSAQLQQFDDNPLRPISPPLISQGHKKQATALATSTLPLEGYEQVEHPPSAEPPTAYPITAASPPPPLVNT